MASDQLSGSTTPEPFAYFDPDSCSWKMCQGSLLEDSGESCTTWPRQGTWDRGFVWALPTSGPPIDASESSSLLPTPSAYESTPTDEYSDEVREHLADTHRRLYLPGRKWHSQRTLSRMAGALLPTPGANDSTGPEGPTRDARREEGDTGGPALRDIAHLLPTPTTQDGANTAGPSQLERNTPPLNAVAPTLLPTPQAADGEGGRIDSQETYEAGKRPSGAKAARTLRSTLHHELLPTPVANPDNPGAGGELRAAITHGPGRRNETGVDSMGRPNEGRPSRLLPTPVVTDSFGSRRSTARTSEWQSNEGTTLTDAVWETQERTTDTTGQPLPGGPMRQPSPDGRPPSADSHPDQLTIEGG
jgi:hypothetical protein